MAKLYFYYSSMNAGKSTILLQSSYNYQEMGMKTMLFTAALDDRHGSPKISSRIGLEAEAELFGQDDDLYDQVERHHKQEKIACVLVDKAQIFDQGAGGTVDRCGRPLVNPCYRLWSSDRFSGKTVPRQRASAGHCGRNARGEDHLPLRQESHDGAASGRKWYGSEGRETGGDWR